MSSAGLGYSITDARATFATYLNANAILAPKTDETAGKTEADADTDVIAVWGDQVDDFFDELNQILTGNLQAPGPVIIDPAADAVAGDAHADADDLIIGNNATATTNYGLTILSKSDSSGYINWGDESDNNVGSLFYAHSSNSLILSVAGGTTSYSINSTELRPFVGDDNTVTLGTASARWSNLHTMAATVYGNVTLSAASPTLTVGDGTGNPRADFNKVDTGSSSVYWQNAGVTRFIVQHESNENLTLLRYNGSAVYQDSPISVNQSNGMVSLGLASTSPRVIVGESALGSPTLDLNKGATDTSDLRFLVSGAVSANVKRIRHSASEHITIDHYNGATWDAAVDITDGDTITLGATSSAVVTMAGSVTLSSASPTLTVGDGTGSGVKVNDKSDAGTFQEHYQVAGVNRWIRQFAADESIKYLRYNAAGSYQADSWVLDTNGNITIEGKQIWGSSGPEIIAGSGTPESAVTAPVGSIYMRTDGGASTSIYVKESGTGNTGWVAK